MDATAGMIAVDLLARPVTIGARVATSTLSNKQAHTRTGTVKEIREQRPRILVALDAATARSVWKEPDDLVVVA